MLIYQCLLVGLRCHKRQVIALQSAMPLEDKHFAGKRVNEYIRNKRGEWLDNAEIRASEPVIAAINALDQRVERNLDIFEPAADVRDLRLNLRGLL